MISLLKSLDLDAETLEWFDLALCQGSPRDWFFEGYEDSNTAKQVDSMCLSCPVMKSCGLMGQAGEVGVWGGVYWNGQGKPDKNKNAHKTPEDWEKIYERLAS